MGGYVGYSCILRHDGIGKVVLMFGLEYYIPGLQNICFWMEM